MKPDRKVLIRNQLTCQVVLERGACEGLALFGAGKLVGG